MKLLVPGPVELPPEVQALLSRPMISHRSGDFRRLYRSLRERLGEILGGEIYILPGTGTNAVDAIVYNYVRPGEKVIVITTGDFGDRLLSTALNRGASPIVLRKPIGDVASPEEVEELLERNGNVAVVAVVHNETSTGTVARNIERIGEIAHKYGALMIVDSVSGVPAEPLKVGNNVDVIGTASHKALLAPPGAAIIATSVKPRSDLVPPSLDLSKYVKFATRDETPFTPPLTAMYAMDVSLRIIMEMGIDKYHEEHAMRASTVYEGLMRMGLRRVPVSGEYASYTVAAFYTPLNSSQFVEAAGKCGYVISAGMAEYKDRIVRIGLMGHIAIDDLKGLVECIKTFMEGIGKE